MSFEVDRYSSAWAHIALCADLTWATEPPDEFIIANQVFLQKISFSNFSGQSVSFYFWYDVSSFSASLDTTLSCLSSTARHLVGITKFANE